MRDSVVAIMQPYLFPYIGYINLIAACDHFVFLDDAYFIKGGWINRNRICINSSPYMFTVPLSNASSNKLINEILISPNSDFTDKFRRQLTLAYKKAPYFEQGMQYVDRVLQFNTESISLLAAWSVKEFCSMIGVGRDFSLSSEAFPHTRGIEKSNRLIAITKHLNSEIYVNSIGGVDLYERQYFCDQGLLLKFIKPKTPQHQINYCNPSLSIIDLAMNVSLQDLRSWAHSYELV